MTGHLAGGYERAQDFLDTYERTGDPSALAAAVHGFRVLSFARMDESVANGLGTALWTRYERSGDRKDLEEAISLFRDAVKGCSPRDAERLPSYLANLAGTLQLRWRLTGSGADLTESVGASRRALKMTPSRHPRRSTRLNNVGSGLYALHVHHADSSALDQAIAMYREAIKAADGQSDALAHARSNLAEALRQRFHTSRDIALLDEAVEHARAVATPAANPVLLPRFRSNLALVLLSRHSATGRLEDLKAATTLAEQALRRTPKTHPNRPERAAVLAECRRLTLVALGGRRAAPHRFTTVAATGEPVPFRLRGALRKLVRAAEEAVDATPHGHPSRAEVVYQYGLVLGTRGDLAESVLRCRQVASEPVFPARVRIAAARQWAYVELSRGDWSAALEAFELAVALLAHTAPRRVTQGDRERALAVVAGLASDAAAAAIQVGKPDLALALLEQGRGVMLGHALDARTELTDLELRHPELARRFDEVRTALDRPESTSYTADPLGGSDLAGERRHALAEEWERLVETIRAKPGFAGFLRGPEVGDLVAEAADHGPVVVVNVSGLRCDALLVAGRRVVALPLPELALLDLAERAERFRLRPSAEILDWLADTVTGPVLRELGFERTASPGELPRLWWIPTGPLTALPLHAARDVLDTVVSSYAPTLRGLVSAWKAPAIARSEHDPLIVAVASAPDAAHLPAVDQEAADLSRRFPDALVVSGQRAGRKAVLDALPRHRWAHFACHATSTAHGFAGSLVLWDHATDPLTVTDIARLRLARAEIAYLSACGTSTAPADLTDEALHLTGAFLMAGFHHVIGTLWPVRDRTSQIVAAHFYDELTATSSPARALHSAVRKVRDTSPAVLWAPFLHAGG